VTGTISASHAVHFRGKGGLWQVFSRGSRALERYQRGDNLWPRKGERGRRESATCRSKAQSSEPNQAIESLFVLSTAQWRPPSFPSSLLLSSSPSILPSSSSGDIFLAHTILCFSIDKYSAAARTRRSDDGGSDTGTALNVAGSACVCFSACASCHRNHEVGTFLNWDGGKKEEIFRFPLIHFPTLLSSAKRGKKHVHQRRPEGGCAAFQLHVQPRLLCTESRTPPYPLSLTALLARLFAFHLVMFMFVS